MERPGTLSGTTTTLHRISRASEGVSLVLADKIITGLLGASRWEASFPEERRAGRAGCRHRGGPEHARASARHDLRHSLAANALGLGLSLTETSRLCAMRTRRSHPRCTPT